MKSRRAHWVPLLHQAAAILRQLKPITKEYGYVFPIVTRTLATPKPISENAILYFITKSAGNAGQMIGHGCRSLFSTWANESGQWRSEIIEKQLAHAGGDTTNNVVPMKAAKTASLTVHDRRNAAKMLRAKHRTSCFWRDFQRRQRIQRQPFQATGLAAR